MQLIRLAPDPSDSAPQGVGGERKEEVVRTKVGEGDCPLLL